MIFKSRYKLPFIILLLFLFVVGRYFSNEKATPIYLLVAITLYAIAGHWVYAYLFNTNMHNHIGLVKPGEAKNLRLLSCLFGLGLGVYVVLFL